MLWNQSARGNAPPRNQQARKTKSNSNEEEKRREEVRGGTDAVVAHAIGCAQARRQQHKQSTQKKNGKRENKGNQQQCDSHTACTQQPANSPFKENQNTPRKRAKTQPRNKKFFPRKRRTFMTKESHHQGRVLASALANSRFSGCSGCPTMSRF